jgi:branched-chain amino acid transport system ATP-binding protein
MLRIEALGAAYGNHQVLRDMGLSISAGEAVAILGPNGAGKSTLVGCIGGSVAVRAGRIVFGDTDISRMRPWQRTQLGLATVPEGRRIIPGLSVMENLQVGAHLVRDRAHVTEAFDMVFTLFPVLADRRRQQGTTLSGGQQQMLAIGRALMSRPKLLLLDEPSLGLAPVVREQLGGVLRTLTAEVAVLLVEQELSLAMSVTDRFYLMRSGAVVAQGQSDGSGEASLRAQYMS